MDGWSGIGIVDVDARVSALIVNETARSVVAVVGVELPDALCISRLYHRPFGTYPYVRVDPIAEYESQEDAQSAAMAPYLFFLSRTWERATASPPWCASQADLWRVDLQRGSRELVLREQNVKVSQPRKRTMMQALHAVHGDGTGGIVTLGVETDANDRGTTVNYGLFVVDFRSGEATQLTPLDHTFL